MEATVSKKKVLKRKRSKTHRSSILLIALLTLLALITLVPFIWMLSASFKLITKCSVFRFNGSQKPGIRKTIPLSDRIR